MERMFILVVLLFGWISPAWAQTKLSDIEIVQRALPGCWPWRCVVDKNDGGDDDEFEPALKAILNGALFAPMVIDGACDSWCPLLADKLRARPGSVCVTPRAKLGFHKTYQEKKIVVAGVTKTIEINFKDPPHSKDILRWAKKKGGFPKALYESDTFLMMSAKEALQFWRPCSAKELT